MSDNKLVISRENGSFVFSTPEGIRLWETPPIGDGATDRVSTLIKDYKEHGFDAVNSVFQAGIDGLDKLYNNKINEATSKQAALRIANEQSAMKYIYYIKYFFTLCLTNGLRCDKLNYI